VLCILYVEDNEDKLSDSGRRARQSGQSRDRRDHSERRVSCCPRDRVASSRGSLLARAGRSTGPSQLLFFANRPTHSSWAATRFSDAGNNGTLRTSRRAAEVGQEVQ
jgi:hypothetical protein